MSDSLKNFQRALQDHINTAGKLLHAFEGLGDDEHDQVSVKYPYPNFFDELLHDMFTWKGSVDDLVASRDKEERDFEAAVQRAWDEYHSTIRGDGVPIDAKTFDEMNEPFQNAFRAAVRAARGAD